MKRTQRIFALFFAFLFFPHTQATAQPRTSIDAAILYKKLCADCHGLAGVPPPDASFLSRKPLPLHECTLSPEEIERVIREGRGEAMPGYEKRLSPTQIREVAEYVKRLGQERRQN